MAQSVLVDTGAEVSVIDQRLALQVGLTLQQPTLESGPAAIKGFQVSQQLMRVVGLADAWILLGDQLLRGRFCVVGTQEAEDARIPPIILGLTSWYYNTAYCLARPRTAATRCIGRSRWELRVLYTGGGSCSRPHP